MSNSIDKQYQQLLQHIIDNGVEKKDRTETGVKSIFGYTIRHKMSDGFPLLTTKKMAWKSIVTELLWLLRGDTNIKFLLDYDCHIWDGDAYKNYHNKFAGHEDIPSKEWFINEIKTNESFCDKFGDLGAIYGRQWRDWGGRNEIRVIDERDENGYLKFKKSHYSGIDQIEKLIKDLKTNPDSRRLMVNAWNVGDLDQMVLPPCHYGFQVYTRELTLQERIRIGNFEFLETVSEAKCDKQNIPKRAISLMWNQRSVDTFLGLPFNIASYGLLLEIIAKEVNMIPDELIGNLGDVHLYSNHIEQAKEQITRTPYDLPSIQITERNWYMHEAVKEKLGEKNFNQKILSFRPDCFELINYQSHPKIKAPLSN